jgi:ActR/RegA family two-component response regulator
MPSPATHPVLLVMPDGPHTAALQRRLARRLGVLPVLARNLGEAASVAKAQPIAAVLLDLDGLTGPTAYFLMDLMMRRPEVRRIGLGKSSRAESRQLLEANLIDGLVQPPIEMDEILRLIHPEVVTSDDDAPRSSRQIA